MATKTKPKPTRKAAKPSKNGRPKKLKQGYLPTMEPPRIPALDNAAERYYDAIRERLPFTEAEKEAKEELVKQIHLNHANLGGATTYKTPDGYIVNFTDVTQVKVKKDAMEAAKAHLGSNGDAG